MSDAPKVRGAIPREKEKKGEIKFITVANKGTREQLELLTAMKNIVSRHLPNMALDYISRIVYDTVYHESLLLINCKDNKPFGGICFRPFPTQGFVEIVFCAVDSTQQVQGFGSYLMQHLKKEIQSRGIYHILTYADNQAIGYFMKQGFHKHVTLNKERWQGYIKDYVEATLMECVLHKNVEDYTDVPSTIKKQRDALQSLIGQVSKSEIRPGLTCFKQGIPKIKIEEIPGLKETGWKPDIH
ncbi:histone acetyltransferase GCN5, putative [Entamoeba dispar SAW760]|uniref:Histone acetyltransferase GCN5, putative n=1 Tax=Entamoeba dispar (strain ATCC PRA-260 / SAW760) TaxID=370354 RepID=B0ESK8_ENTDS|nr:histone acetyltransferase GCN5, putative [Entamoeba dispar SAW760]EDR22502.1 histone acetyltransferase GCN5, putative [Entamoeba dispar SAW760]|eukprot:EDR22502.1 histone acetyltransferase GCN5, putative [Entamoeba dispar SAW760]